MLELKVESLGKIEEWLEIIPSKFTRKNYKFGVKRFETGYGRSIVNLIGNPEAYRSVQEEQKVKKIQKKLEGTSKEEYDLRDLIYVRRK
jgi:hypothetical protein